MKLTIIDSKSHEPLLILMEDDRGLNVIGGDPKMVQVLGLQQFSSLKEIADYINSAGSDVQALLEEGEGKVAQDGSDNPDMDARIKPALDMIKTLMMKVNERKKAQKVEENSKKPETALLNTSASEIVLNPQDQVYVSIDGDNIGNAVARAEEMDDEDTLAEISNRINTGQSVMKDWAIRHGGYVIEQGGDEGLIKVPAASVSDIENMRDLYRQATGATASVGVGKKISEATKARVVAKLRGKNQTVVFDPSIPKELELRLKDQNSTEANKIRAAMRPQESTSPEEVKNIKPDVTQNPGMPQEEEPQPEQQAPEQEPQGYRGEKLHSAWLSEVQQEEKPKQAPVEEEEEEEENPALGSINRKLIKHMAAMESEKKPQTGTMYHDPEIEGRDFSHHDDPEFAKTAMYMIKHGGRKT